MQHEITFPRIGEDVSEAKIIDILVREGDLLVEGQTFANVATDKVDIELPSPLSGVVQKVFFKAGDRVKVNEVLLVVSSQENGGLSMRKADTSDVKTAILYLSSKNSEYLCSRPELGRLRFEDFKGFVDEVVAIAQDLDALPIEKLDDMLLDEFRDTLYLVSDLIREFVGFHPEKLGLAKLAEHTRISKKVQEGQEQALQAFYDISTRAFGRVGRSAPYSPKGGLRFGDEDRAYVFISYSHIDKKVADELARRLSRARIQFFLDTESIAPGQKIDNVVYDALNHASHIVVVISPALAKSAWVPYELGYAMARDIIVLPYLVHESMDPPSFIANYKYLRGPESASDLINLVKDFRRLEAPLRDQHKFFSEWNSNLAQERIKTARAEVCLQAANSYTFLSESQSLLTDLVQRGGTLRCILVDPQGDAVQMATKRSVGADRYLKNVIIDLDNARKILSAISQQSTNPNAVQLKVVDYLAEPVMTIVDPNSLEGTMFVTLNGFEKRLVSRPSFVLHRERDNKWFEFYQESFENLWAHELCRSIDLQSGLGFSHKEDASPEPAYEQARERAIARMRKGLHLGVGEQPTWTKDELHER